MTYRRRRPPKQVQAERDPQEAALEADIEFIRTEERRLSMELLDVICDVTTPEGSDDDDDDEPAQQLDSGLQTSQPASDPVQESSTPLAKPSGCLPSTSSKEAQAEKASTPEPEVSSSTRAEVTSSPDSMAAADLLDRILRASCMPTDETAYSELYMYDKYKESVARKLAKLKKRARSVDLRAIFKNDNRFMEEKSMLRETYPEEGGRQSLYELVAVYNFFREEDVSDDDDPSSDEEGSDDGNGDNNDNDDNDDDDDDDKNAGGKKMKLGDGGSEGQHQLEMAA